MTSEVLFNYLGAIDELVPRDCWIRYHEPLKLSRGPNTDRAHLIEINAMVVNGKMQVDWTYNQADFKSATVHDQGVGFMNELRQLINGRSLTADVAPEKEFSLAKLDSKQFDKLAGLLQKADSGGLK